MGKRYADLDETERLRARCRSYTNVLIRRGVIRREGCKVCGEPAQAHHADYTKPREVTWLCRWHHNAQHSRAIRDAFRV